MGVDNGLGIVRLNMYQYFWHRQWEMQMGLVYKNGVIFKHGDWEVTACEIYYKGICIKPDTTYRFNEPGYDGPVSMRFSFHRDIIRYVAFALAVDDSIIY